MALVAFMVALTQNGGGEGGGRGGEEGGGGGGEGVSGSFEGSIRIPSKLLSGIYNQGSSGF